MFRLLLAICVVLCFVCCVDVASAQCNGGFCSRPLPRVNRELKVAPGRMGGFPRLIGLLPSRPLFEVRSRPSARSWFRGVFVRR